MKRKGIGFVALALVGMFFLVGCSSGGDDPVKPDPTVKFVGKWVLPYYQTPGKVDGQDGLDVVFNADGSMQWYKHGDTFVGITGTFTVDEDEILNGTWRHTVVSLHGTCVGTLLDNGRTLDFLMHEELPTGIKTNHFRGERAK